MFNNQNKFDNINISKNKESEATMICEGLLEDAKKIAKLCLDNNEEIREVPFGEQRNVMFVTTNHKLIVPVESFEIDGTTFYFGHSKD